MFDQEEYTTHSEDNQPIQGIKLKTNSGNELFEVCAMYEYGEAWTPETDSTFDYNDVSWGTVWVMDEESHKISIVMDKEVE